MLIVIEGIEGWGGSWRDHNACNEQEEEESQPIGMAVVEATSNHRAGHLPFEN